MSAMPKGRIMSLWVWYFSQSSHCLYYLFSHLYGQSINKYVNKNGKLPDPWVVAPSSVLDLEGKTVLPDLMCVKGGAGCR